MKTLEKKWIIVVANIVAFVLACFMTVLQNRFSTPSAFCTNMVFGYIYFLIFELVFLCLCDYILQIGKKELIISLIGTGLIFAAVGYFIVLYLHTEKDIYTWDSCVYWIKAINQEKNAYSDLKYMFENVKATLGTQEYNDMAAVPLVPFVHYFGATFVKYVFYNYSLYYSPACIVMSLYITRVVEKGKFSAGKYLLAYVVSMLMPGMFLPLSDGYLDVIGILFIALMLHTVYGWDYTRVKAGTIIRLSVLSLLLLLARRWYAFFIVGFYFALGIEFVVNEFLSHKWNAKNWRNVILNYVLIVLICVAVLLVVAPEIFTLFLGSSYSDAYSAYKTRTFYQDFWEILKDFGCLLAVIAFGGIAAGITSELKNGSQRKWMFHLTLATLVTFALFQRVQSMGEHHRYLMMPLFLTAISYAILKILGVLRSKKAKGILTAAIMAVSGMIFLNSFSALFYLNTGLLSQIRETPAYRDDIEEINRIVDYLIAETDNTNKKIYIAVDSSEFSQELLNRSKLPERVSAVPAIIGANIKDTRDGFPSQAFLADYLIVAPTLENNQKIISDLTDLITENEQGRGYYSLVAEETVTGGVPICIYKKNAPITGEFVDILSAQLQQEYPDNEFVYKPNYFVALVNVESAQNFAYYSWITGYEAQKGAEENLQVSYVLDGQFEQIEFDVANWYPDMRLQVMADDVVIYDEIMNADGSAHYEFDVDGVKELQIEISGEFEQTYTFSNGNLKRK